MRGWVAWLALAGCDRVFDLHRDAPLPCPAAIGHDEDHDGMDDACDNCPATANGDQRDDDGDLVGDACDPEPAVYGDVQIRFYSFGDPADAAIHWDASPLWTFADDAYLFDGLTTAPGDPAAVVLSGDVRIPPPFEIQTRLTIDEVDLGADAVITIAGNTGANQADLDCHLEHAGVLDQLEAHTKTTTFLQLDAGSYAAGNQVEIRTTVVGPTLTCELDRVGQPRVSIGNDVFPPSTGRLGVLGRFTRFQIDSMVIYQLAP